MEEKQYDLQEYADENCGGDRFRAIYELMSGDEEGAFDPYVNGLTRAEANFAVYYLKLHAVEVYGSEKDFANAVKINSLLAQCGMEEEEAKNTKKNPFVKGLWKELLKMLCAILLPFAAWLLFKLDAEVVGYLESILIGLQAFNVAGAIIAVRRFRKLKKLMEKQPPMRQSVEMPTFEACMAAFEEGGAAVPLYEAEDALHAAKKERLKSWLLLPVYALLILIGFVIAKKLRLAGGILSAVGVGAFATWRIRRMFKTVLKTRDAVDNVDASASIKILEHRQSMGVLGMMLLLCIYFLAAVFGCIFCIAMAVK